MYLLYSEYQSMGGTLDEPTFNDMEREARHKIDWYTFNRLKNEEVIPEDVKECMYSLIKLVYANTNDLGVQTDENGNPIITSQVASQSNDGVSTSYNVISAKDMFDMRKNAVKECIDECLSTTVNSLGRKLLYRGLYPNE